MGAVTPFLFASTLSSNIALVMLLFLALLALRPSLRFLCLFPGAFLCVTLVINDRIAERLPLAEAKSVQNISGVIGSLPEAGGDLVRFIFLPDVASAAVPPKIRVYWYKNRQRVRNADSDAPQPRAGERWQLALELRPARGRVNFHGSDAERWYFTDGIGALGYVKRGNNVRLEGPGRFDLQSWRQRVLEKLTEKAAGVPGFRVLAALAIADRRGLLASDREVLAATGTGHLLAISGLHIGLAATVGFYLGRLAMLLLPLGWKQRVGLVLPWCLAWCAALSYAGLSGFGVSTQRALIMLTVATAVVLSRRTVHPLLGWLIAMAMVLLVDPFAPLRAGFWFSFGAVAVLLMLFVPRYGRMPVWRRMVLAQLGISLLMAPLGMYWFQQASLPGLLANLVAIPIISTLVVPPVLLALPLMWVPGPVAGWLLWFAGHIVHWLFLLLEHLAFLQPEVFGSTRAPGLAVTLLAMFGALLVLLPRGIPGRYAGLLMMLPMLLPAGRVAHSIESRIDFLDVGQGLAVLVSSRDYLLVYDTGPGNGRDAEAGWDMVAGTLLPMIEATGKVPDLVVVSHADLDHAGGLKSLQENFPDTDFLASLPHTRDGVRVCAAPAAWTVGNLAFKVLHPSVGLPYLGNDSSCVVSVKGSGLDFLLSGDISRVVEQRLVSNGLEHHDVMSAPHHGSLTSSSQALIDAVMPDVVLISAGSNNRFGFPREAVMRRYAEASIVALNTAQCGGLRITTGRKGDSRIESARTGRPALWRWPAAAGCP